MEDLEWTMDIRTKSQGGEPTYNVTVGKAGKGNIVVSDLFSCSCQKQNVMFVYHIMSVYPVHQFWNC